MSYNFGLSTSTPITTNKTSFTGFGTPSATPAATGNSTLLSSSVPNKPSFGLTNSSFGLSSSGVGNTTAAATLPTNFSFAAPSSTAATLPTNFSFAPPSSTAATLPTNFSFATPSTGQPTFGLGSSLTTSGAPRLSKFFDGNASEIKLKHVANTTTGFVTVKTPTKTMATLGGATTATTTTTLTISNASLGGGTLTTTTVGLGGVAATSDGVAGPVSAYPYPAKDRLKLNILPKEILTTVDSFKDFVKKQKVLGSDIMRISYKPLQKVTSERAEVASEVTSTSIEVTGARAAARRLRENASRTLRAAEGAVGTYESDCPPQLLWQVIIDLESSFISLRQQLHTAEIHLHTQPRLLTQEELNQGICRIYESLVALAGRLQIVHSQVQVLKERHLKMRKRILNDNTDIFRIKKDSTNMDKLLSKKTHRGSGSFGLESRESIENSNKISGPTPFTYVGNSFTSLKPSDNNPWGQGQKNT